MIIDTQASVCIKVLGLGVADRFSTKLWTYGYASSAKQTPS